MASNPNQTPTQNFDNVATIKAILEQSEKTKTERTNTELKLSNKDVSRFFAPAQQDIRTPSPPKLVFQPFMNCIVYARSFVNYTSVFVFIFRQDSYKI